MNFLKKKKIFLLSSFKLLPPVLHISLLPPPTFLAFYFRPSNILLPSPPHFSVFNYLGPLYFSVGQNNCHLLGEERWEERKAAGRKIAKNEIDYFLS